MHLDQICPHLPTRLGTETYRMISKLARRERKSHELGL